MRLVKNVCIFIFAFLILSTILYGKIYAHTGGGPPFLEINGIYAQTNPYYLGNASINLPQDNSPDSFYLVDRPIEFKIDTKQLLIPQEIVDQSVFRWSFAEGSKDYTFGTLINYTYHKPKTYLVSLEVKAPGENDFTLIDTVQVNIVSHKGYQLPQPSFTIETDNLQNNKPIILQGKATYDSSAKFAYLAWDLGDGTTSHDWTVTHTYHDFTNYITHVIILRVIDSNQFVSDAAVIAKSEKGNLVFIDGNGNKANISVALAYHKQKKTFFTQSSWIFIVGILIGIVILIFTIRKKMKR